MQIHQQNIILTGAASGIGQALLHLLCQYDCTLIANDLQSVALPNAAKAKIITHQGDVSTAEGIDALFEFALQHCTTIDIFIANAGFAYYEMVSAKADWQHIEKIFALNVFSPLYSLQKMKQYNTNRKYYVLATASAMAHLGVPGYAFYGATKAALARFWDSYRYEKSDQGKLGLVYPIATRTAFFDKAGKGNTVPVPFPSQTAQQVAKAMLYAIKHDRAAIYPSWLFRFLRLPHQWYAWIHVPYQWYYAGIMRQWLTAKKTA
ncbi:MAG: SDR family NAD(P)-dependent oxidoreductase [Cytophagales bacterium]|nr:MAG: SDR family NAD(P)-dependent oxidoreductase [Cytophagales bacterium]